MYVIRSFIMSLMLCIVLASVHEGMSDTAPGNGHDGSCGVEGLTSEECHAHAAHADTGDEDEFTALQTQGLNKRQEQGALLIEKVAPAPGWHAGPACTPYIGQLCPGGEACPANSKCPDYTSCNPHLTNPHQYCPNGERCMADGYCKNAALLEKAEPAPGWHAGPACTPNIGQFCPGGEACPSNGKCPDYTSCNPHLTNPHQYCPNGERCMADGYCKNAALLEKAEPAPGWHAGPACTPYIGQLCPGGEACPANGKCPDYTSCNPHLTNPHQYCPNGERCMADGYCKNTALLEKAKPAPGWHAGPACTPYIGQLCPGGEVCPANGKCPDYTSCNPYLTNPHQYCPNGERCMADGYCKNAALLEKAEPAPGWHAGPACTPNIGQFCPGGEACPANGKCPDYTSCNPYLTNPHQYCPNGERCMADGYCKNTALLEKAEPAPGWHAGPACTPYIGQLCPGGEVCPANGKCPDYTSCNPYLTNPHQYCPNGERCMADGYCKNVY